MAGLVKISEATALAMHALAYLASSGGEPISASSLAEVCKASEAHMVKVCQRLAKAGFLTPRRGPGGGFTLTKEADAIYLSEVYSLFEGSMDVGACLLSSKACGNPDNMRSCIFGAKMADINLQIAQYFNETKLSDIAQNCGQALERKGINRLKRSNLKREVKR